MESTCVAETFDNGVVSIGQRIYCGLYGGKDGIVVAIVGEQSPGTCRNVAGSIGVAGGKAYFDIIWDNGTESRRIPESLARSSVQWKIHAEIASESEIAEAKSKLAIETARRTADKEAKEAAFREECSELRSRAVEAGLISDEVEPDDFKRAVANIRLMLKVAFPKVKFSVRKDGYDCVGINWEDGPTCSLVNVLVNRFQDSYFDSTEDIERPKVTPWTTVYGGMKYVSTHREQSDGLVANAIDMLWQVLPGNLKELEKPTPETVFKTWEEVPGLSGVQISEAVRTLANHYDCLAQRYRATDGHHLAFVVTLAVKQQEA